MPEPVLERAQAELLDWNGTGMSVMEVSHRGKDFVACAAETEALLREVMNIPDNYSVLFIQGGASGQFAAIPMNITKPGDVVNTINTGQWSKKAVAEAKKMGLTVEVIGDQAASNYTTIPSQDELTLNPEAKYLHYTPNETIGGVAFDYVPAAGDIPLVADMSSNILSVPIDVSKFGIIYAGTQKNMGPAGMAVVIIRNDLLNQARPDTPSFLDYTAMAAADSMLNTPPTFAIYLLGLTLQWIKGLGGLEGMAELNRAKAELLYNYIDASPFYSNPVAVNARSWMNVPFVMADSSLDKQFVAEAAAAGLMFLAGHRSVGGMRASIYNAMPLAGVAALVAYMKEFEARVAK